MTKDEMAQRIDQIMRKYYTGRNLSLWWDTPFRIIGEGNESPRQLLETGKGPELLGFLEKLTR